MQTSLVEIVADAESWPNYLVRQSKEHGWKAGLAGLILAPVLPEAVAVVAGTAGLVSGIQQGIGWLSGSASFEQLEISKAALLRDQIGLAPKLNTVYARHPDASNTSLVIVASEFHNFAIREQISELVEFIHSRVRAEEIDIIVSSENGAKLDATASTPVGAAGIKAHANASRHHTFEQREENPQIINVDRPLFWMQAFPEVTAALKGANKGTYKRSVVVDTTFGLSASLAERAGIDTNWLGKQRFDISVKYA